MSQRSCSTAYGDGFPGKMLIPIIYQEVLHVLKPIDSIQVTIDGPAALVLHDSGVKM